jgi:hypothetical protein
VDWIYLAPLSGCCEHGNEPSNSVKVGLLWPAEQVSIPQDGFCFIELFI